MRSKLKIKSNENENQYTELVNECVNQLLKLPVNMLMEITEIIHSFHCSLEDDIMFHRKNNLPYKTIGMFTRQTL